MATLSEIRAQYPQYQDMSDEQLADGLYRKHYSDMPRDQFDAKVGFKRPTPPTTADTFADVGEQTVRGFNRGLNDLIALPGNIVGGAINMVSPGAGDKFKWDNPVSRFMSSPEAKPQTDAGRYADASGRALGASAVPSAAILGNAGRMAALAPTTTTRAVAQTVGQSVAARPGVAAAADVAAAVGSGVGQQFAADEGFGATGQMVGGMVGGFTPLAIGTGAAHITRGLRGAAARSDPHARVAAGLGDGSVDDLANDLATGATGMRLPENRRTLDVLGQEMVRANGDRAAAHAATIARLQAEDGLAASTAADRVRRLASVHRDSDLFFGEYPAVAAGNRATRRMQPQNVADDVAGRVDDVGTHWEIDNIANAGTGVSGSRVRNAVTDRFTDLADRTRQIVQGFTPGGRTIQDADAMIEQMRRQAQAEYRAVHNTFGQPGVNYYMLHGLLRRVIDRHTQRMYGRSGEQREALDRAVNEFFVDTPHGRLLMPDSQMMQDMRGVIRGMITQAERAGRPHIVSTLQPLYRDVTRVMERAMPQWARVNRRWADMRLSEVAQELGDAFSKAAGPRFREQMREFRQLAPEAQDVVRIHVAQKFVDMVDNAVKQGKMTNLGQLFASDHTRQMVRTLFGDDAGVRLVRLIRDHTVAAKSAQMLGGSPTAARLARQKDIDTDLGLLASIDQANIGALRKFLMDWTINMFKERRNKVVGRVVTTPIRDTSAVAENLERMRQARIRAQSFEPRPVRGVFGVSGHAGGMISEDDSDPRTVRGMIGPLR